MVRKRKENKRLAGFTLIELLVVIAIIGVLTTIVMVSVNDLRARARDDRRLADMKTISDALGLYRVQQSTYPIAATAITITGSDAELSAILKADGVIQAVPSDPNPTVSGGGYTYQSSADGSTFVLKFCLETDSIKVYGKNCASQNQLSP